MKYLILYLLTFTILVEANLLKESVIHEVVLDGENNYLMRWSPKEKEIIFELQVATQGYIGFGFSHTGGMGGSDIVFMWVCEKGIPHISDRHATGNSEPLEDFSQDYTLFGGFRNATHTVMHFSRPWTTCDNDHDYQLSGDTVKVIWAYSEKLPSKGSFSYHEERGTKTMYLQEPRVPPVPDTPDIKYMDIRAQDVLIPNTTDTTYWCWMIKLPKMAEKHHFIGYVPLVDEESKPFFHHLLVRECIIPNSDVEYADSFTHKGHVCKHPNMPESWTSCVQPIIVWAVGSEGEMLPDHVGIPLHEEHGGATYFMIETHYDNPFYKQKIDRSGVRIYYTANTRKQEAGILEIGHRITPIHIIPPKHDWVTLSHCSAECLRHNLPEDGINVISGLLHTHLLGRKINIQVIRDGIELEPLLVDNHYDFDYQQLRVLPEERVILPEDHLITTCGYNSSDRSVTTFGGRGTYDEMCLSFLLYYPKIKLLQCNSAPKSKDIFDSLTDNYISNLNVVNEKKLYKDHGAYGFYNDIDDTNGNALYNILMNKSTWKNTARVNKLQETIMSKPHHLRCQTLSNILFSTVEYPNYISIKKKGQGACALGTPKDSYTVVQKEDIGTHNRQSQFKNLGRYLKTFINYVKQQMEASHQNDQGHDLTDKVDKYVSEYITTHKLKDYENNGSSLNYQSHVWICVVTSFLIFHLF